MEFDNVLEAEIKLLVDDEAVDRLEQLLISELGDGELFEERRAHYYFDFPDYRLEQSDTLFRKVVRKPSYCLKIGVASSNPLLIRKEIFTYADYDLDFRNPLHRSTPVVSALRDEVLGEAYRADWAKFEPRVQVTNTRRIRYAWQPSGDRAFVVSIDQVDAKWVRPEASDSVSWTEAEVEVIGTFPECEAQAVAFAHSIRKIGGTPLRESKYKTALGLLRGSA
jgi:hypothetical protein